MSNPALSAPFADPPAEEVHVLLLAARNSRAALLAVEDALAASDAELCRLSLKPVGAWMLRAPNGWPPAPVVVLESVQPGSNICLS